MNSPSSRTTQSLTFGSFTLEAIWDNEGLLRHVQLADTPPSALSRMDLLHAETFLSTATHLPPIPSNTRGKVLQRIQQIPMGQTLTYGAIARDCFTSPRAVGAICASNPLLIAIPCHRVVAATTQGGYAAGTAWKSLLLATEKGFGDPRK